MCTPWLPDPWSRHCNKLVLPDNIRNDMVNAIPFFALLKYADPSMLIPYIFHHFRKDKCKGR